MTIEEREKLVPKAIKRAVEDLTEWMIENPNQGPRVNLINTGMRFYDDSSGQRTSYLEFNSYGQDKRRRGIRELERYKEFRHFMIRRKLSFQNRNDFGKDGAVLTTVYFNDFKNVDVSKNGTLFVFDNYLQIDIKNSYDITNINKLDEAYVDHKGRFILETVGDYYKRILKRIEPWSAKETERQVEKAFKD